MKKKSRSVAAFFLAAVLSIQLAPIATATGRDDRGEFISKFARLVRVLQRFIGISTHDDSITPPRP